MEGPRIVVVDYIYAAFYGQQAVHISAFLNNVKYLGYLSEQILFWSTDVIALVGGVI
jgi:hypothetical protein